MKEADVLGGEDIVEPPEKEKRSCDKFHHFMRSVFWQPNHLKVVGPLIEIPQVIPPGKISEYQKKHITRSGK